mgnify:CR=1 FL=1
MLAGKGLGFTKHKLHCLADWNPGLKPRRSSTQTRPHRSSASAAACCSRSASTPTTAATSPRPTSWGGSRPRSSGRATSRFPRQRTSATPRPLPSRRPWPLPWLQRPTSRTRTFHSNPSTCGNIGAGRFGGRPRVLGTSSWTRKKSAWPRIPRPLSSTWTGFESCRETSGRHRPGVSDLYAGMQRDWGVLASGARVHLLRRPKSKSYGPHACRARPDGEGLRNLRLLVQRTRGRRDIAHRLAA